MRIKDRANTVTKKSVALYIATMLIFGIVVDRYEGKLSDKDDEVDLLSEDNNLKNSKIVELESDAETLKDNISERDHSISSLNKDIDSVKKELDILKKENNSLINKNNELNGKIKSEKSKQVSKSETKSSNKTANSKESGRTLNVVATAYTAFCPTGCIGVTATGHDVSSTQFKNGKRVIAVDPNVIPLGSTVRVESGSMTFTGIAEDTGGAIKGNKIDILVKDRDTAYSFGVQNAKVTVLSGG